MDRVVRTGLREVMGQVVQQVPMHPAELGHLSLTPPAVLQDRMIITDLQDQMGAPTALVMPVELNDERRVDRTVLTDRTVTTAHMVVMDHMVHTVPAAPPVGSIVR